MNHMMHASQPPSLNRTAFSATVHCLTGCAIGEIPGMAIGTALGWSNWPTVTLSVALAFVFGYSLPLLPLLRAKIALGAALGLAFLKNDFAVGINVQHARRKLLQKILRDILQNRNSANQIEKSLG
ncbi:MAG: DUF4396 domain-containing protein, partial [candidate division KSB1 bacterium]|nr:DUF4396 domain-containing protein [candidate division KSB1 bacterium]